nr:twin-arginine translocase TatA/TatE family subunit [Halomicrobium salinisoli]
MVVSVLQIGLPGTQEMMIILLIAVLLFGANKIPKLARSTGQAMGEFQKGREEVEQELEEIKDGTGSSGPPPRTTSPRTSTPLSRRPRRPRRPIGNPSPVFQSLSGRQRNAKRFSLPPAIGR